MKLLFKYTSRSRRDKFFFGLDSIVKNVTGDYIVLCTFDIDDLEMNNEEVRQRLDAYDFIVYKYGSSDSKVQAINRDCDVVQGWDILINMSDDMEFIEKGFDEVIVNTMKEHFPDTDGVLHFPDGFTQDRLMTLSIMGKAFFDRFSYIYNPEYISLFADNEATEVAQKLGKYKYIDKQIFTHNHPAWGKAESDEQYVRTEGFFNVDKETYKRRKKNNFYL